MYGLNGSNSRTDAFGLALFQTWVEFCFWEFSEFWTKGRFRAPNSSKQNRNFCWQFENRIFNQVDHNAAIMSEYTWTQQLKVNQVYLRNKRCRGRKKCRGISWNQNHCLEDWSFWNTVWSAKDWHILLTPEFRQSLVRFFSLIFDSQITFKLSYGIQAYFASCESAIHGTPDLETDRSKSVLDFQNFVGHSLVQDQPVSVRGSVLRIRL